MKNQKLYTEFLEERVEKLDAQVVSLNGGFNVSASQYEQKIRELKAENETLKAELEAKPKDDTPSIVKANLLSRAVRSLQQELELLKLKESGKEFHPGQVDIKVFFAEDEVKWCQRIVMAGLCRHIRSIEIIKQKELSERLGFDETGLTISNIECCKKVPDMDEKHQVLIDYYNSISSPKNVKKQFFDLILFGDAIRLTGLKTSKADA